MDSTIKDFLLIESLDLKDLMQEYHDFFLMLIPSVFILAAIIEFFADVDAFALIKRAVISILVLAAFGSFYHSSIDFSISAADEILKKQTHRNIMLRSLLDKSDDLYDNRIKAKDFYKEKGVLSGSLDFIKYMLFDKTVNNVFTLLIYFINVINFFILKIVYSIVYYLGFGLIGIPCVLYIFPKMDNVLRGGIISYIWLLIVPHILVFIVSLIGIEIAKGYTAGQVIGGSITGTVLLTALSLFMALIPLIATMILSGSGISAAGGMMAALGVNHTMNLGSKALKALAAAPTKFINGVSNFFKDQAAKKDLNNSTNWGLPPISNINNHLDGGNKMSNDKNINLKKQSENSSGKNLNSNSHSLINRDKKTVSSRSTDSGGGSSGIHPINYGSSGTKSGGDSHGVNRPTRRGSKNKRGGKR